MGMAALAEPLAIKISSKRQITIPAKLYKEMGFDEYALCTWTEQGLLIQPLDVEDEDVTVDILKHLIAEGVEGEALIERYKEMRPRALSFNRRVMEGMEDIEQGRIDSFDDMQDRIRTKYGL